jgi:hypothetical protein
VKDLFPLRHGLWHRGSFAERKEELRREAERDPVAAGLRLYEEKRYEEAEPILRWAAEREPDSYAVYFALARSLWQVSRWTESVPFFARAAELNPDSGEAHLHYGEALLKVGKFADAEHEFRQVIKRRPLIEKVKARLAGKTSHPALPPAVNPADGDIYAKLAFCIARRETVANARRKITAKDKPNTAWKRTERGRKMTVRNVPIITRSSRIFTMGSCFALEIRHELRRRGFDVYPKYDDIKFDESSQILDSLPDRDNINHYDTFTIRQEIELAFGQSHYKPEDFWEVRDLAINKVMGREAVYQDPYRKNIYASDRAGILDVSKKLGATIRDGLMQADVYIFTLGLIESWLNTVNGLYVCSYPGTGGGGGAEQTVLHVGTFQENYENLKRVCDLIFSSFPQKQIVLTVSPVALERTFRDMDVVVANMESKTLLRAAAGQICREYANVHYLPSFELFVYHDLAHDNGRHATRDGVETVLDLFGKSFLAPDQ